MNEYTVVENVVYVMNGTAIENMPIVYLDKKFYSQVETILEVVTNDELYEAYYGENVTDEQRDVIKDNLVKSIMNLFPDKSPELCVNSVTFYIKYSLKDYYA